MTGLWALVRRDTKLYFKDKGMFFSSLITPIILLVLYETYTPIRSVRRLAPRRHSFPTRW